MSTEAFSNVSSSSKLVVPDFFLYTTLNQNQTKDLRKSGSNREQRLALNHIFNLGAIKRSPSDPSNKVDQLILDFHYNNFQYCES